MRTPAAPLPVTVLSGFLGAGKTSPPSRCLVTAQEAAAGEDAWRLMPDPFPQWRLDGEEEPAGHHHSMGSHTGH